MCLFSVFFRCTVDIRYDEIENVFMQLIYVVEDHSVIREGVAKYLEHSGFSVRTFADLTSARRAFASKKPDLLIQDVMLPDGDGFDFVQEIRKISDVPVVFMTAKVSEQDRIKGFSLGADDYICKPFSPKELVLRVQAILHRVHGSEIKTDCYASLFSSGNSVMKIDRRIHNILVDGQDVCLTAAEWRILTHLIERNGAIVPRSEILSTCFDYSSASYERIADTHIKNLRAKLGSGSWIETIRGFGYRFSGVASEGGAEK